jgi:hypothetical protein
MAPQCTSTDHAHNHLYYFNTRSPIPHHDYIVLYHILFAVLDQWTMCCDIRYHAEPCYTKKSCAILHMAESGWCEDVRCCGIR